jgi:hypothetical protein
MKTCLVCGAQSPASAATCPMCGEASWSAVNAVPPAPDPAPSPSPNPGQPQRQQQYHYQKGRR